MTQPAQVGYASDLYAQDFFSLGEIIISKNGDNCDDNSGFFFTYFTEHFIYYYCILSIVYMLSLVGCKMLTVYWQYTLLYLV